MPNDGFPPQRFDGTNHGRSRNEKTSPDAMRTAETMKEVAHLRAAGATFREIGTTLGIDRTWAQTLAKRALAEAHYEAADEMRVLVGLRLDRLHRAYWPRALNGDLKAAEMCRRLTADQRQLFGLDAPTRIEVEDVTADVRALADELGVALPDLPGE
jgi:hypothetical protein